MRTNGERGPISVGHFKWNAGHYVLIELDNSASAIGIELTSIERELVGSVADGLSNKDIAAHRKTSPHTVANQLARLYRKLGVSGRAALIVKLR
jgi:DNA-binding CsgD family transcriptional regulator